jgi:hypothetical protein
MYYAGFCLEGYSEQYIESRKQIDRLCNLVIIGGTTAQRAFDEYQRIESDFNREYSEMKDLFRMIYYNRLKRLVSQFPPEKIKCL